MASPALLGFSLSLFLAEDCCITMALLIPGGLESDPLLGVLTPGGVDSNPLLTPGGAVGV